MMMMDKKNVIGCCILGVALAVLTSSCSKQAPDQVRTTPETKGKIGVTCMDLTNPFFKLIANVMEDEAKKHGYTVVALSGELDPAKQNSQMADFVAQKYDAIFLNPVDSKFTRCVIHPQFSNDGSMIAWSERVERGRSFGGGWVMKVGRFTDACKGGPRLTDIVTLTPGEHSCFYEVHDFSPDDSKLLFSGDLRAGQPHTGLDLYELELKNGGRLTRLTHTDTDWDEHAHYSPDGRRIAWMSSKGLDIDYGQLQGFGLSWTQHLKTELWVMNADGTDAHRVTGFNVPGSPDYADGARCIVSDSTWDPDGSGLCVCISAEHNDETMKVSLVRIDLANR